MTRDRMEIKSIGRMEARPCSSQVAAAGGHDGVSFRKLNGNEN